MTTPVPGTGISADDIESVAAAQMEMMPELVRVWKHVLTRDQRGGTKATWPGGGFLIIGRVGKVADRELAAFAGQLRGNAHAVLTVPVGSDVAQQDRVEVLGVVYEVARDMSKSSYATASRYLIEEV